MRKLLLICLASWALVITACALVITACAFADTSRTAAFTADGYFVAALEYAGPNTIVGVSVYGPADKPELCQRAAAALIAQGSQLAPRGHVMVGTCLHVKFNGPLTRHGAVVVQPFTGVPAGYILVAMLYAPNGQFVGAKPLHAARDEATARTQAQELIDSNIGRFPAGVSLLIYCLPVPTLLSQSVGVQSI